MIKIQGFPAKNDYKITDLLCYSSICICDPTRSIALAQVLTISSKAGSTLSGGKAALLSPHRSLQPLQRLDQGRPWAGVIDPFEIRTAGAKHRAFVEP